MVLAAMPDIEAIEVVDRFFELGAWVVGSGHPVGIFLAGCRECLTEWEVQVARGRVLTSPVTRRLERHDDAEADASTKARDLGVDPCRRRACPRGQNGSGPQPWDAD